LPVDDLEQDRDQLIGREVCEMGVLQLVAVVDRVLVAAAVAALAQVSARRAATVGIRLHRRATAILAERGITKPTKEEYAEALEAAGA
jgi:hypothetical protein